MHSKYLYATLTWFASVPRHSNNAEGVARTGTDMADGGSVEPWTCGKMGERPTGGDSQNVYFKESV